jgi:ATPase family associated with various cellular activities (AAA)/Winged helix domain, variant
MNDVDTWQENNSHWLSVALAELRQRLEKFCQKSASENGATPKRFSTAPPQETKPDTETPSALELLSDRLGLSQFERNVLFLCTAMELDTRIAGLCARAQDDPQKNFPTFALALALFDEPSWDALTPERPLRFWRLIEISQLGSQPLTVSALRADERIVNYVKGLNHLDERFSSLLWPLEISLDSVELAPSQQKNVELILRRWEQSADTGWLPAVQLVGADSLSKQLVAYHAAAELNRRLYRLPVELLSANPVGLDTFARLWQRESRLLPLALYLTVEELNGEAAGPAGPLNRFLSRSDGVFFVGVREILPHLGQAHVAFDIAKPTAAEQKTAWRAAFGDNGQDNAALLAGHFNLNLPTIHELSRLTKTEANGSDAPLAGKIWEICCASERPRLDRLAQRLVPKVTWDDLVLPADEMNRLKEIAAQVKHRNQVYCEWGFERKMNRGFSISALFAGDSGTGKTMAAEVIANELRLNLYRIDLSAVVNKYIGETEKNLRRLFDAAEGGGAILFFDEADALFGKRSEVKDSHDRYANIEINYLLQRIESYRGLAILATNMKSALDTAFMRRLRFIVNFPYPTAANRRRLWEKVFLQPDAKKNLTVPPLGELDYEHLAKLNLTGGHIHSAALNAAFHAAAESSSVTMRLVLDAVKTELLKLDRPVNEADFYYAERASTEPKPVARNGEAALV